MTRFEREDNGGTGRFLLYHDNKFAGEIVYRWVNEKLFDIVHTEVDSAFGGKGFGKKLIYHTAEFAREKGLKIMVYCPYAKKVFDSTETLQDVLYNS